MGGHKIEPMQDPIPHNLNLYEGDIKPIIFKKKKNCDDGRETVTLKQTCTHLRKRFKK